MHPLARHCSDVANYQRRKNYYSLHFSTSFALQNAPVLRSKDTKTSKPLVFLEIFSDFCYFHMLYTCVQNMYLSQFILLSYNRSMTGSTDDVLYIQNVWYEITTFSVTKDILKQLLLEVETNLSPKLMILVTPPPPTPAHCWRVWASPS
jgi:hypothetical protein